MSYTVYNPNDASGAVNGLNVSRVALADLPDGEGGFYIQVDDKTWIEQDRSYKAAFSFEEVGRERDMVSLTDPSREVGIRLNTANGKVLYSSETCPWRNQYTIVEMSSDHPRSISRSAKEFNEWCASGGEQRVGLPPNSMGPLNTLTLDFRYRAANIFHDVAKIKYIWTCIEFTQSSEQILPLTQILTAHLNHMQKRCEALVAQATECSILVNEADGADAVLRARITALEQVRKQLGLLRPVGSESANSLEFLKKILACVQMVKSLVEAQAALRNVATLNSVMTAYQNSLSRAGSVISKAFRDVGKAHIATSEHLGTYYCLKAGKEIDSLVAWTDTFQPLV